MLESKTVEPVADEKAAKIISQASRIDEILTATQSAIMLIGNAYPEASGLAGLIIRELECAQQELVSLCNEAAQG